MAAAEPGVLGRPPLLLLLAAPPCEEGHPSCRVLSHVPTSDNVVQHMNRACFATKKPHFQRNQQPHYSVWGGPHEDAWPQR